MSTDYKSAGVDVNAGYRAVELMRGYVESTFREGVLGSIGGFAGAFDISAAKDMRHPVLLSGTDGVGTKLKLAFILDRHDTIGIDCVAMCVNDIAVAGGEPLFFLDYIACGKNIPERIASIVKGVAEGCTLAGCALVGGETAEMPGFYDIDEYDLAGFATGIAEKDEMTVPENVATGDALIGVASSGLHSNGFSLVRKVLSMERADLERYSEALSSTVGEALLKPTAIYAKTLSAIRGAGIALNGASHITGGGFYENIPRTLPEGKRAYITKHSFPHPPVFDLVQREGDLSEDVMYNTFNMGLGLVLAVKGEDADACVRTVKETGHEAFIIGEVIQGEKGVTLS